MQKMTPLLGLLLALTLGGAVTAQAQDVWDDDDIAAFESDNWGEDDYGMYDEDFSGWIAKDEPGFENWYDDEADDWDSYYDAGDEGWFDI